MIKTINKHSFWVIIAIFLLSGCREETGSSSTPSETAGADQIQIEIDAGEQEEFHYLQDLGNTPKDVYFIFTNTSNSKAGPISQVLSIDQVQASHPVSGHMRSQMGSSASKRVKSARKRHVGLRGSPEISAYNNRPLNLKKKTPGPALFNATEQPDLPSVGDSETFVSGDSSGNLVYTDAIARKVIIVGDMAMVVWVDDSSYSVTDDSGCIKAHCMTPTIVDTVSEIFLKEGANNDVYEWVTNVFGVPWGEHEYYGLIGASFANRIDVLFFDIDDDDSTSGGALGMFWSKDNYLASPIEISNERLMFYLDSVLTATPNDENGNEGGSWDVSDVWPAEMVSTLAHEFQHMIHFYQKAVLRLPEDESGGIWLNEMASLVTEDLLATKLGINGPRDVTYLDGSAGSAGNRNGGRINTFNSWDYVGVTEWYDDNSALINYGVVYAFGAYLARNYGGAELFRKIVRNEKGGVEAITVALQAMGSEETFLSLLQKWPIAVILSDDLSAPIGYRYNTGDFFTSAVNGVDYQLGSINFHNYDFQNSNSGSVFSGPWFFSTSNMSFLTTHDAYSNTYVEVGLELTGMLERRIIMPANVELSVITRSSN